MNIKKILSMVMVGIILTSSMVGCKSKDEKDIEKVQKEIENMEQENKKIEKEKDGVLSVGEIMEDRKNGLDWIRNLDLDDEKYFNGDIIVHGYVQALSGDMVILSSSEGGDGEFYCHDVMYGNDLKKGDKIYIRGYANETKTLRKARIIKDKDIDKEIKLLKARREEIKNMRDTKYDVVALMDELKNDREAFWEKYYGTIITITGVKAEVGLGDAIFLISNENEDLNEFNQNNNAYISFASSEDIEMAKVMQPNQQITSIGRLLPDDENLDNEETLFYIANAQLVKDVKEQQEKPNFENINE